MIDIGQDFTVPAGRDLYKDFTVQTNFKEGKWIRAAQVLPGNRKVVHHVHFSVLADEKAAENDSGVRRAAGSRAVAKSYFDEEDGLTRVKADAPVVDDACAGDQGIANLSGFDEGSFATMLPGKGPDIYDVFGDGSTAKYIPAGAKVRFQVHYASVSTAQVDRTSVGLYFASRVPERPLKRVDMRNRFFLIPAGDANHEVKRCYDVEQDKLLLAITPHAHYRGKDATYELVHADGRREILLGRAALRFQLAAAVPAQRSDSDGEGQPHGGYLPLRQQREQSGESESGQGDSLGRSHRRRNDGDLDGNAGRCAQGGVECFV